MAHTDAYKLPLLEGRLYHIFNRSINKELVFYQKSNYPYFLKQYQKYLRDEVDTYAYCLLPNHFHFFIKAKSPNVSSAFRRFFQSYVLALNRQQGRRGSLLERPFKRQEVKSEEYISHLIRYIHSNPQKHGLIHDYKQWEWSSFRDFGKDQKERLTSPFMDQWFLNENEYHLFHDEPKPNRFDFL